MNLPKGDSHAPDGLGLEAVAASDTSPMAQARDGLVEVLNGRSDKGAGVLCIDFRRRLANDVAVEEGHGLSKSNRADNEGDEEQGVDTSHDKKTEVSLRPVVADADYDVKGRNASLEGIRTIPLPYFVELTTLSVPTNSLGGSTPVVTIIWTKLEQMPMMRIMQMAWRPRTTTNILERGIAL